MRFSDHIHRRLQQLERQHLLRTPHTLEGPQGPEVLLAGRSVVNLSSNNYLGLAADPRLSSAVAARIARLGLGSGASRLISGTETHHHRAEARLATFVGLPASRLFSSGYAANLGTIQALMGPGDLIFSDALNHASLIDGCRLSRATVHVFPHRDYAALRDLLRRLRATGNAALLVTDALFSMDGTTADLRSLRQLADGHDAALLVDEAHCLGVLGPGGAGLAAAQGVTPDVLTGMLGKAFGLAGGFTAAPPDTVRLIENAARSYVFSTAPPPALGAAACVAADLVAASDDRRARLRSLASTLHAGLRDLGYSVPATPGHIIPVHVGEPATTMALSARLLAQGVFVHGVRPPTVPPGTGRLRVSPMATHTDEHVKRALAAFAGVRP